MSSAALIALGVTVLVGWALDLVSLKSLHPALASMKANTAWLFVALGCALRSSGREERAADHVRRALTVVVIAVSVATLGEDLVGIDLGIDELPFSDPITRAQGDPPGRMSIATALSFLLLGVAVHRVKNNLQVISSLINLQARQLGDARARGALEECRSRVEAIALIHEKLYQAKDYARVAFSDYVKTLACGIFQAAGPSPPNVSLEIDTDVVTLPVDRAIPCALILNELITNSLKHAFPLGRRGLLRVVLRGLKCGTSSAALLPVPIPSTRKCRAHSGPEDHNKSEREFPAPG